MVLLVGHRANSWSKINRYLKWGVDALEIDLSISPDGELAVGHGYGSIKPATLREAFFRKISSIFLKEGGPKSLNEFLSYVAGRVRIWLDIKDRIPSECVARVLHENGVENIFVSSKYHDLLRKLRNALPTAKLYASIQARPIDVISIVEASNSDGVAVEIGFLDVDLIETLHSNGYSVAVWVVNDVDQAIWAASIGADIIITDRPDLISKGLRLEFRRGFLRKLYERLSR